MSRSNDWSVKDALDFANTLANHGWTRDANADAASSCIYALCRMIKNGGNAAAMRNEVVLRLSKDAYKGMQEALSEHDRLCEMLSESRKSVGNAAAMREALIIAKKAICHHAKHICQSLSWENSNIQSNCADVLCAHRDLCEAKTAIKAALAAPPRNCDRFKSVEDAHDEWLKTAETDEGDSDFMYWLFATAEERKGE